MPFKILLPERINATEALVDAAVARGLGDRAALYTPDGSVTYHQLQTLSEKTADLFRSLDVQAENRVAFCLPDGAHWLGAFFGAIRMGAVAVPLNARLQSAEYSFILTDSRARVLVVDHQFLAAFEQAIRESPYIRHVLVAGKPHPRYPSFERLLMESRPWADHCQTSRDDAAFWLYTSGTTGTPKGVIHLQHDCLCCEYFARDVLNFTADDIPFSTSKLFFAYALGNIAFTPLRFGAAALLYPDRPTPREIIRYIQEHRPTLFFSVPNFYAAMLALDDVPRDAFASVRLCISAGEALPAATYHRWQQRFGTEILDGIGCSESIYTFISNRPGQVRPGATGQLVSGFSVQLVDEQGSAVPQGQAGALLVKAESCCAGYWAQEERTRQSHIGEWLSTGDVMSQDEDGYFYHHGRKDDLFKVNGEWIAPAMLEHALMDHPAVKEIAMVGLINQEGLTKPFAFVVPADPEAAGAVLAQELIQYAATRLTRNRVPRGVHFVDELPRTATGKVQRFKLRQTALVSGGDGRFADGDP